MKDFPERWQSLSNSSFMPVWARRYVLFVGLPCFAIFTVLAAMEAPTALIVMAFLGFFSAAAIRGFYILWETGRGNL